MQGRYVDVDVEYFDRGNLRGAIAHVCEGGVALAGWFDAGTHELARVGRRFREMRLFGYDRTAILRLARGFGVRLPLIAEGLGAGVPFVRLFGAPVGRALAACGVELDGAA